MITHALRSPAPRRALALLLACALLLTGTTAFAASGTEQQVTPAQARRDVATAYAAYQAAQAKVAGIGGQVDRVTSAADAATDRAARLRAKVVENDGGLLDSLNDFVSGDSSLDDAEAAAADAAAARDLETMVQGALADAIAETESTRQAWEKARRRQEQAEQQWSARQFADAAIARAQFQKSYAVRDRAQDRRNKLALRAWTVYLSRLADAGVTPPAAAKLADPDRLPATLEPVRGTGGAALPGVAQKQATGNALTVLSSETVEAVSESLHRVGLRQVPDGGDPATYSCGAYVAQAWGSTTMTLPADAVGQWNELREVRKDSLQVGDVVVLGAKKTGLDQTGVFVGEGLVLMADELSGTVGAQPLPAANLLGVRRATVPASGSPADPPYGGVCGEDKPVVAPPAITEIPGVPSIPGAVPTGGALTMPIGAGTYTISAGYGQGGGLWSSGQHTGQDFAAPSGTPVYAAADGVVTIEHPSWAGNLVRIDHGGGVETLYGHLLRVDVVDGQTVTAGEPIAAVGSEGNSTGPHLHFEVRLDGYTVDPVQVLDVPELPRTAYTNGEVPEGALCDATADGAHHLRCDAAVAYRLLDASYTETFGTPICITDSYRSRAAQEDVFVRKPGLAATPGTSNHGWGLATDLCGGIERFDTPEHDWMVTHGPEHGWVHPSWAGAGGSRPEPWHFEYGT
jgi:murein DD-endopeptidase MepM/ murein hydrolase activator NlpD